uniref:Uncharacterized protein n=1 Tax=Glossina pallidipes TaxID=7398 RepID=A0A1B0A146_GLOPL
MSIIEVYEYMRPIARRADDYSVTVNLSSKLNEISLCICRPIINKCKSKASYCLHVPTGLEKSFHTVNQPTHADIMCSSDSDSNSNSKSNNNNNNNFHLWSAHPKKDLFAIGPNTTATTATTAAAVATADIINK